MKNRIALFFRQLIAYLTTTKRKRVEPTMSNEEFFEAAKAIASKYGCDGWDIFCEFMIFEIRQPHKVFERGVSCGITLCKDHVSMRSKDADSLEGALEALETAMEHYSEIGIDQ